MIRKPAVYAAALAAFIVFDSAAQAQTQVRVRVPFVEVDVGPGVRVRAPFVNLWIPTRQPVMVQQPAPEQPEIAGAETIPLPRPVIKGALTVQEFAKVFKAREGIHEVTMLNPFTKTAANVRFALPAGAPERITVAEGRIEFVYGPRSFVRIEFDENGAIVTSR